MKKFFAKIKSLFWGDEKLKGGSALFIILVAVSTVALIASNIAAGKSFALFSIDNTLNAYGQPRGMIYLTCGVLCFPITYIISDLMSEVYGYSASRRVTWLGFALNLFLDLIVIATILIPAGNGYYAGISDSLRDGFGFDFLAGGSGLGSLGILIASLTAFIVGSWVDDIIFEVIKKATIKHNQIKGTSDNGFKFCLRAIGSSFAGEVVDSLIFIPLLYLFTNAYVGQGGSDTIASFGQLMLMIGVQVAIKTAYEIVISPLTHLLAKKLKAYEAVHKTVETVIAE